MKKMMRTVIMIVMALLLAACSGEKEDHEGQEVITLSIDEIKENFFLAQHPWPSPLKYKVFANLEEDYCVGDFVDVYYEKMTETKEDFYEITSLSIESSDFELEEEVAYKPVIYLYPTQKTNISVSLDYNGVLIHTYPVYSNGWNVTAYPDGTLVDNNGIEYPYLFWEGKNNFEYDMTKGFCVSGRKTERFLRDKLSFMGLNEKELNDFIEFWIPFMEKNPYNQISFQTANYTENAKLIVNPKPDSILRVFMVFQPLDEFVEIEEQMLNEFKRTGFVLVEWGGSIK